MAIVNDQLKLSDIIAKNRFDSEYFQPDYVKNEKNIRNSSDKVKRLSHIAYITDGDHSVRKYVNSGIPFLTSENFSEFIIDYDTERYITPQYEKTLARSRAEKGAIFITKTGKYYGKAAICLDDNPIFNIPADVGKIRITSKEISPFFVVAFLNSKYGITSIRRENSGGTRDRITLVNLGKIEIPLFEDSEIENSVRAYIEKRIKAKNIFKQAQALLEKELHLENVVTEQHVYSVSSFRDIIESHRLDAQHYQKKFKNLIDHLSKFHCERISDIRIYNRRGIQPCYVENGTVDVVNSQHISDMHLMYDELQKTSEKEFIKNPDGHVKENDLLIYATGAHVGQTNIYLRSTPALASNHVNLLRIQPIIDPAYICIIFQSIIGRFQTEMHARGSAQAELYPFDIDKFIVPILPDHIQQEIGGLVRESYIVDKESALLLENIKAHIEGLIEGVKNNEAI